MTAIIVLILRIAMLSLLFAFILWICVILWRSLKSMDTLHNPKKVPTIILTVENPDLAKEQVFNTSPIVIGRSPNCDLVLDDHTVSAIHTLLTFKNKNWWIEDRNSMNGTQINHIALEEPLVLMTDDLIQCGQVIIKVLLSPK